MATKTLVRRRSKRGRPRKDERQVKTGTVPVFIGRDPQGIKLFTRKPVLQEGLWQGALLDSFKKPLEPKEFVALYRNAKLPGRGQLLEMEIAK